MESTSNHYQIAGIDDRDRGFTRQTEIRNLDGHYQAIFRYETFFLDAEPQVTEQAALANLIKQLQKRRYTQLYSRLQFRRGHYLGTQEIWEEHQEPESLNLVQRLIEAIRRFGLRLVGKKQ